MNLTGKLVEIFETAKIKDTFQKREFVLEYATNPKYPELIKFEVVQDKCPLLDDFRVGQDVVVEFDLRGRRWTDQQGTVKYFNTLQAWRVGAPVSVPGDALPPAPPSRGGSAPGKPPESPCVDFGEVPF